MSVRTSQAWLRRFEEAVAEMSEAQKLALHPIEKHVTNYWIARTHEAAGRPREAMPYHQAVAADPIPSWMRQRAIETLGGQKISQPI